MIIWSENLILGETIKKKHRKVIHAIKKGRWISGVYLIAYPSNPANLLDLIPAKELLFPIYKRSEIHILGLANGKKEAERVAAEMIKEVYQKTGGFRIRDYFG